MSEEHARQDRAGEHSPWALPAAFTIQRLRDGWRLLANCELGGTSFQLVLICPAVGVALLEVDPVWTPGALDRFHEHLAAAGFGMRFPGRLPVIHRRLRPVDVPALEMLLADAFVWLEPITVEADTGWEDELQALLTPATPAMPPATLLSWPVASPPPEPAPIQANAPPANAGPEHAAGRSVPVASHANFGSSLNAVGEPRRRSNPWIGIAAIGLAATAAFLSVALRSPEPKAMASVEAAAAPEPAATALGPATALPASPAALAFQQPPAAVTSPSLAASQASPQGTPISVLITPLARQEALPEPPDVQSAPFWATVAVPAQIGPPSEPERVAPAPLWTSPVGMASASRLEPLPEPDPLDGLPFWAQPMPDQVVERAEPMEEDVPLEGLPFWATPPPPLVAPPAAATAPGVMAPAIAAPSLAQPVPPLGAIRPPVEPPVTRPAPAMSAPDVEAARRRGEALAAIGDISGARRFLERAARGGSGAAALAMAESFDPRILAQRGVVGLRPDRAAALTWYHRALVLGVTESASRIANLEAER